MLKTSVVTHVFVYLVVSVFLIAQPSHLPLIILCAVNFESLYLLYMTQHAAQEYQKQRLHMPEAVAKRLNGLWDTAHKEMRKKRLLQAEKALLTILRIDERNAAAYNRLGILYAKQREYSDAINCFKTAASLEPSAAASHNLGLIYYEVGDYKKAKRAFQKALEQEDNLAARHVAYAKVLEKLGDMDAFFKHLKIAYRLDSSKQAFELLYGAYEFYGMHAEAEKLRMQNIKRTIDEPLLVYKYGADRLNEAVDREHDAVDKVLARHGL